MRRKIHWLQLPSILKTFRSPENVPDLTFETLPSDLILETLEWCSSFDDLKALIFASPTYYRLFEAYSTSILMRIAKNIIRKDAWEFATRVLVYQRHTPFDAGNPSSLKALLKALDDDFTMRKEDISQLVTNQRFFHKCVKDFATFVCHDYTQLSDITRLALAGPTRISGRHICSYGDIIPSRLFYQIWELCFRCRRGEIPEDVYAWGTLERFSSQRPADNFLVFRIMRLTFLNHHSTDSTFLPIVGVPRRATDRNLAESMRGSLKGLSNSIRSVCGEVRKQLRGLSLPSF